MPELPEVESLARILARESQGQTIERVEVAAPWALKTYHPPISDLVGRPVEGVQRWGKYLGLRTDGPWLVMHLARGGWIQWREVTPPARAKPGKGPLAARVGLSGGSGFDVTEAGTEKRLALWVVNSPEDVAGVAGLGPDPLSDGFSPAALAAALHGRTGPLKSVLTDQKVLAGVGNAYSDEVLHAARLSPFKPVAKLTGAELAALYQALVGVLRDALERSSGLGAKGLKGEKKAGLAVHGRAGEICATCGDTIREVSYATSSFQYCPTCQTGGRVLADRRLSRLLK